MRLITYGQVSYSVDRRGFLELPELWDENFAERIAPSIGIGEGLSGDHWRVIHHLRRVFCEWGTVPYPVLTCVELGLRAGQLRRLFPTGFTRGACKAAGLNLEIIATTNPDLLYENKPRLMEGYRVGPEGFLHSPDAWDRCFAHLVAAQTQLPHGLTGRHWAVLRFLRDHYDAAGMAPSVGAVCRHLDLSPQNLADLFPAGYERGACRAAGLPKQA
ncbi:MAG: TusE/DsrC/DsvC family sulfur relay protein [Deltaproteobacteria bacterium]|nr:TusE/DsrC/DsvC family sulfur relay protein [Deltaproteobacteria bacterium]